MIYIWSPDARHVQARVFLDEHWRRVPSLFYSRFTLVLIQSSIPVRKLWCSLVQLLHPSTSQVGAENYCENAASLICITCNQYHFQILMSISSRWKNLLNKKIRSNFLTKIRFQFIARKFHHPHEKRTNLLGANRNSIFSFPNFFKQSVEENIDLHGICFIT